MYHKVSRGMLNVNIYLASMSRLLNTSTFTFLLLLNPQVGKGGREGHSIPALMSDWSRCCVNTKQHHVHTAYMWSHTLGADGAFWQPGDQTVSIWPQLAFLQAWGKPRLPHRPSWGLVQQRASRIKPENKSWVSKTIWNRTPSPYYSLISTRKV